MGWLPVVVHGVFAAAPGTSVEILWIARDWNNRTTLHNRLNVVTYLLSYGNLLNKSVRQSEMLKFRFSHEIRNFRSVEKTATGASGFANFFLSFKGFSFSLWGQQIKTRLIRSR